MYAFFAEKKSRNIIIAYILGVIFGTIIFNYIGQISFDKMKIYGRYLTDNLSFEDIKTKEFFIYIFEYRIKEFAFFILLGITYFRNVFQSLFIMYLGIKFSLVMCALTVAKGTVGILWFILLQFPQIIIYVYILYYIVKKMEKTMLRDIHKNDKIFYILKIIIVLIGLILLEVFCEAYINPVICKKICLFIIE